MAIYLKKPAEAPQEDLDQVQQLVRTMLRRIESEGESAVREYSRTLDQWDPADFRVGGDEVEKARRQLSSILLDDIHTAKARIEDFAKRQMENIRAFEVESMPGVILGQKQIPVQSVGCYIPGGRYPLIASAFMSVLTAKVAGVPRVAAACPPRGDGIWPATLYAIALAGADEIYCVGGVQALGALAFGALPGLMPVDMITGPGNKFVAEAKRQLFGRVGIDLLAGPTEILIIADDSADPYVVAADLIGQAEHDPVSRACLVTTSETFGREVLDQVDRQLPEVQTREIAGAAWAQYGEVVVCADDEEAAAYSDAWAPEHLEVQTRRNDWYQERLKNYGSLFLGEESTVLYSDKALGTNHTLPTRGAARYTGGLWVGKFLKTVTYQKLTRAGSVAVAPAAMGVAAGETMWAHVRTGEIRLAKYNSR